MRRFAGLMRTGSMYSWSGGMTSCSLQITTTTTTTQGRSTKAVAAGEEEDNDADEGKGDEDHRRHCQAATTTWSGLDCGTTNTPCTGRIGSQYAAAAGAHAITNTNMSTLPRRATAMEQERHNLCDCTTASSTMNVCLW